ncbi:MAG: nitroreductase family protein [Candidatus Micrarchaeota archaeon]
MDFYDVLRGRHSIRAFQDKNVDPESAKRIIDAAMSAPSAGNLQSYKVYIVSSPEAKAAIAGAAHYQEFLAKAPFILVFCADQRRAEAKYEQRGFELYSIQDATIACAYAQLAVAEEGLGSVWVGSFDPLEVSRIVHAMGFEVPIAMLPVGHPAEPGKKSARRPLKEMVKEV